MAANDVGAVDETREEESLPTPSAAEAPFVLLADVPQEELERYYYMASLRRPAHRVGKGAAPGEGATDAAQPTMDAYNAMLAIVMAPLADYCRQATQGPGAL